ncbi:MAG: hypothetical protein IPF41_10075 [Flavobacteriales bacterium]|nr:hypothetical protein [Flavobacteriales bacterium]
MRTLLTTFLVVPLTFTLHGQSLTWAWAWGAGSAGSEFASVSWAPSGAVHVLGNYENTIDAHGTTVTSSGQGDAFVQQLDPADGNVQWTAEAHHTADVTIHDVAYRNTGEIIVCGTVAHNGDAAQFGALSLAAQPFGTQAFVAALSHMGQWNWVSGVADPVSTEGFLVKVDANNNILLGCRWGTDLAVYRFTGQGVQGWAATANSSGSSVDAYAMDVMPDGDLVITGRCYGTGTFGTHTISVVGTFYDAFVARLSSSGTWEWAVRGGGSHWDKGFGICADASGNVYVAGTYRNTATFGAFQFTATGANNDGWMAKLDGSGQWLWALSMASIAYMEVYDMDLAPAGDRLALTGNYFVNAPTLGGFVLPAPAMNDVYVAEIDTAGQFLSAMGFGSAQGDQGLAISYGANDELYVAGTAGATMVLGAYTLVGVATPDLWLGRLDPDISTGQSASTLVDGLRLYLDENVLVLRDPEGITGLLSLTDAIGRTLLQARLNGASEHRIALPDRAAGMIFWQLHRGEGKMRSGKLFAPPR